MFKKQITQLTKSLVIVVFTFSLFTPETLARLDDQVEPAVGVDPIIVQSDRTAPINLYFPYGSLSEDTDITNAIGRVTIDDSSLEFVDTSFEDIYYGDPNRPDSDPNIPTEMPCGIDSSGVSQIPSDAPRYAINASLISPQSFTYGLQSARNNSAPSGASLVDAKREKHTGCLKVSIRVSPTASTFNQEIQVIFDEDYGESPEYVDENTDGIAVTRPGFQIKRFQIEQVASSSSSSSESSSSSVESSSSNSSESSSSSSSSSPAPESPRSGGFTMFAVFSGIAVVMIGIIAYKSRSKNINKIDLS